MAETPDPIIARIRKGEKAAFDEWLTRHRPALRRWTDRAVGVSPGRGGDASDVVQDAYEAVWRYLKNLPPTVTTQDQLLGVVRTRLRYRAIDLSRQRVLHGLPADAGGPAPGGVGPADFSTASTRLSRNEREQFILRELTGGPDGDDHDPLDLDTLMWDPLESTCRHASLSIL